MKLITAFISVLTLTLLSNLAVASDYPLHQLIRKNAPLKEIFALMSLYDINSKDGLTNTPLHYAGQGSSQRLVRLLIQQGAEVDAQNALGYTALMLSARKNKDLNIINELIKKTNNINLQNNFGSTVLHTATNHPKGDKIVQTLIRYKADPSITDNSGYTPLVLALKTRKAYPIIYELHKHTPAYLTDPSGAKAIHWTAYAAQDARWISLFKDETEGLSLNNHGRGVLHYFAEGNNNLKTLRLLLKQYSALDIDQPDRFGTTPLMLYARYGNNVDILKFMLEKGADPARTSSEDLTPLMYAARYNKSAELITELARHSDVQFQNNANRRAYDFFKVNMSLRRNEALRTLLNN